MSRGWGSPRGNIEKQRKKAQAREIVFTGIKLFDLVASVPLRLPGAENNPSFKVGKLGRFAHNMGRHDPSPGMSHNEGSPWPFGLFENPSNGVIV